MALELATEWGLLENDMETTKLIQEFFQAQVTTVNIVDLGFNLVLAAALAHILAVFYVKYGASLSNRRDFGNNFIFSIRYFEKKYKKHKIGFCWICFGSNWPVCFYSWS